MKTLSSRGLFTPKPMSVDIGRMDICVGTNKTESRGGTGSALTYASDGIAHDAGYDGCVTRETEGRCRCEPWIGTGSWEGKAI